MKFDITHPPVAGQGELGASFCQYRGENVMCGPRGLAGETAHLFHNNGDGTFTEVTDKAGVANRNGYYGLAAAFARLTGSGRLDLAVANDSTPNYLFRNRGDGTFSNDSFMSGFAVDENGREQASMGLAIGDYDNDGAVDVYVTNFSDDFNTLYHANGDDTFSDLTSSAGIKSVTIPFLGWGTQFLDFDNDGLKDIIVANGHVYPSVDRFEWGTTYAQRPLLLRNRDGNHFDEVLPVTGTGLAAVIRGRGLAVGDLFNDGHIDVVINAIDSGPLLLRNVVQNGNHWLEVALTGSGKSPRDAVGAVVYVTARGRRQRTDVISGGSYCSSSDFRLHFGLGAAAVADAIEIHWPSGQVQKLAAVKADRIISVVEPPTAAQK